MRNIRVARVPGPRQDLPAAYPQTQGHADSASLQVRVCRVDTPRDADDDVIAGRYPRGVGRRERRVRRRWGLRRPAVEHRGDHTVGDRVDGVAEDEVAARLVGGSLQGPAL